MRKIIKAVSVTVMFAMIVGSNICYPETLRVPIASNSDINKEDDGLKERIDRVILENTKDNEETSRKIKKKLNEQFGKVSNFHTEIQTVFNDPIYNYWNFWDRIKTAVFICWIDTNENFDYRVKPEKIFVGEHEVLRSGHRGEDWGDTNTVADSKPGEEELKKHKVYSSALRGRISTQPKLQRVPEQSLFIQIDPPESKEEFLRRKLQKQKLTNQDMILYEDFLFQEIVEVLSVISLVHDFREKKLAFIDPVRAIFNQRGYAWFNKLTVEDFMKIVRSSEYMQILASKDKEKTSERQQTLLEEDVVPLIALVKYGRNEKRLYGDKALRLAWLTNYAYANKTFWQIPQGVAISSDFIEELDKVKGYPDQVSNYFSLNSKGTLGPFDIFEVSVRSSPSVSMPGLLLTMPGVRLRDILGPTKKVAESWNNPNAIEFRRKNKIEYGSMGVIVQKMVYGDGNDNSAAGVFFTRDIITGEDRLTGRFAAKVRGETIVTRKNIKTKSIDKLDSEIYKHLEGLKEVIEKEFKVPQEVEFVIEDGKLWILQVRDAVLSPQAQAKVAVDMANKGLIDQFVMLARIESAHKNQKERKLYRIKKGANIKKIGKGTSSSPGATQGTITFSLDRAREIKKKGKIPILVAFKRPEDIEASILSGDVSGIVTQYGHEALHESVLARSQGIPLVDGIENAILEEGAIIIGGRRLEENSEIVLDGSVGEIYISEEGYVLEEDRTVSILGIDFNYTAKENEIRAVHESDSYEELLLVHARLTASLKEAKEVTLQNLRDNLEAHLIHQLIFEKAEKLGKSKNHIREDINRFLE